MHEILSGGEKALRKFKMGLMAMIVAVSMLLLTAQVAMATVTAGGASSAPQTGSASSSSSTGSTATTSGTGKTGGEVVLFAAVGAGLLGTGYLLTRKSKA